MRKKAILCINRNDQRLVELESKLNPVFSKEYLIETGKDENYALNLHRSYLENSIEIPAILINVELVNNSLLNYLTKIKSNTQIIITIPNYYPKKNLKRFDLSNKNLNAFLFEPWIDEDLYLSVKTGVKNYFLSRDLTSIIKMSQRISSILDINELLEHIMITAVGVTGAQRGYLFMVDEKTQELEIKASQNVGSMVSIPELIKYLVEKVFGNEKELVVINNYLDDDYIKYENLTECGLKSIICLPVTHHNKRIGVCYLDNPLSETFFTTEDLEILRVFISQASIAIENANLYTNLEKQVRERTKQLEKAYYQLNKTHEEIKRDLKLAKRVQENILPKHLKKHNDFNFYVKYKPMGEVGGDVYDIELINKGYLRIFLADATGHGVQAALVTMIIKEEYQQLKTLIKTTSELLDMLNKEFINAYESLEMFFSCIVVDIDLNNNLIKYSSAGHPNQYIIREDKLDALSSTGSIVGSIPNFKYKMNEIPFSPNNKLILFTDGLFEQFNQEGEEYGESRLKKLIDNNKGKDLTNIPDIVLEELDLFMMESELNDDITVICVEKQNNAED